MRHVFFFCFGIEFLVNKEICIFGHFIFIDCIKQNSLRTCMNFYLIQLPHFVGLELGVLSVNANDAYL